MNFTKIRTTFIKLLTENKYFALATILLVLAFVIFIISMAYNFVFARQEQFANFQKEQELPEELNNTEDNSNPISSYGSFNESCNVKAYEE